MLGDTRSSTDTASDDHAALIYRRARSDLAAPPGGYELVTRLGGSVRIYRGADLDPGQPHVQIDGPRWSIAVRPDLPLPTANLAICRGIAHWYQRRAFVRDGIKLDELAMTLMLPAAAARHVVTALGWSVQQIASHFILPRNVAEIRLRQVMYDVRRSGLFVRTW